MIVIVVFDLIQTNVPPIQKYNRNISNLYVVQRYLKVIVVLEGF